MKKPSIKQLCALKVSREAEVSRLWEALKKTEVYQKIKKNRAEVRQIEKEILKRL